MPPLPLAADEYHTGWAPPDPVERARLLEQISSDLRGRYEVRGYLGRGAYATVWQAFDMVSRHLVAVKRFDTRPLDGRSFYRELRVMFRLVHPRVVRIINFLENTGTCRYLILEHCAGGSLRSALSRAARTGDRCSPGRAATLTRQLAEGLAAAHELGLVHRDLKPENVLFDAATAAPFGGRAGVKLADFGLARALQHAGFAASGATLRPLSGSPAYMAPEQFAGSYSAATDMYALGVILFELLHGARPFEGTPELLAYHHLRSTPTMAGIPRPWRGLVAALLHKEPAHRPSARELLAELAGEMPPGGGASFPLPPMQAKNSLNGNPLSRPSPFVLAVAGLGGGVGRTTAALALAWCWGQAGGRVALVDLDPGGATRLIATDRDGRCPWANVRLRDALGGDGAADTGEVVLVDCPPLTAPAAWKVLGLAHGVLLVTQAGAPTLRTAAAAEQILERARQANPSLAFLGTLMTAFDAEDRVQSHVRRQLQSRSGTRLLEPPVPLRPELRDWALRPGSDLPAGPGRDAYLAVASRLAPTVGLRCRT